MMRKTWWFFFMGMFIFGSFRLFAGNNIDSLRKQLVQMKEDTNRVKTMNLLARELTVIGDYPQADSVIGVELKLAQALNFKRGIANALKNLGVTCYYRADYSHSLEYLIKSLNIYQEINYRRGQAIALKFMGAICAKEGDSTDAASYLYKALDIFMDEKDTNYIAISMLGLGNLNETHCNRSGAMANFTRALELFKMVNNKDGIASALMYMGNVYSDRGDYARALGYYSKAIKIFENLGDNAGKAATFVGEGTAYRQQGNYAKALEYGHRAISLARSIGSLNDVKNAEMELSAICEKQGDKVQALLHYKAYNAIRDTIFNLENTQRDLREAMNLDFTKKEALEKAEEEKNEALHREEVRKKEATIYFITGILFLAIGFAGYVYWGRQQSNKASKIIEEKNRQINESISYAERIQRASLPAKEDIQKAFPQSFILYMPKDIVCGDFYFFTRQHEKLFLAVADCTGHGIPGAFMSMVCSEKLSDAVKVTSGTGEILKQVNAGIKVSLHQTDEEGEQDGMDIALCSITPSINGIKINYSGANRPLWVIPKGADTIEELLPARKSVGTFTSAEEDYNTYIVQLQEGDTFYMFTDGYPDQFGGDEGKKISAKRFGDLLLSIQNKTMPEQEKELVDSLQDWKKDLAQQDDILVIGVRV